MKWLPFILETLGFQKDPDFMSLLFFFASYVLTDLPPFPLGFPWFTDSCRVESLYFPNSLPSTVVPVSAVYIPKLGSFPQPCLSPPNTSQFAHFSFKCDVQNKHSFSVLEVTDGQKAVCLLCVWRTACLSEIFDCSFLLSVTESGQDRAVHTFLPTHPDPLKTTQYLPINAT